MGPNTKSLKIERSRIDSLVEEIRKGSDAEILACKSKHEILRAKLHGKLIIIYSSGSVVYHDSSEIESLLAKYPKPMVTEKKRGEAKPINVKLNEEQKTSLIDILAEIADSVETPGEYEEAAFVLDGAKITLYTTGSVYSPHGHPEYENAIVMTIEKHPIYPQYDIIIGQDEVGKGELFGPMIVGSVALTQDQAVALQLAGVKDSKDLPDEKIDELTSTIRNKSLARWTVPIHAKRFNELFEEFKEEEKSLNDILAWAHSKALEEVLFQLEKAGKDTSRVLVIIDEFNRVSTDKRLECLLKTKKFDLIQTPRAESLSTAVAAGSIIAKYRRNTEIKELEHIFNVSLKRRNLDTILKHPKAPEAVRYVYIEKVREEPPPPNTVRGGEADAFLDQLLLQSRLEGYNIDFKRKFPRNATDIGKIVAGMANCNGGNIYFGIKQDSKTDDIEIIGLDSPQKVEERISGIVNNCEPSPKIDYILYIKSNGTKILRVRIPMSPELVYFEHRYYKRTSSGTAPMMKYDIDNWPDSCRRKR